jgi:DNA mismatch endonuclease (patch repair protein)
MVDVLSPAQRRRNMQRIRSKDTKPELQVRRLVHSLGYRYRLHTRELPGRPDLVFRARRKVIFVHGCYWHVHTCGLGRVVPATNAEFWRSKRQSNADRDVKNLAALRDAGWKVLVIWQCEISTSGAFARRIRRFLDAKS